LAGQFTTNLTDAQRHHSHARPREALIVQSAAQTQKAADFIIGTKFDEAPASTPPEVDLINCRALV
jgi:hypothetical protein